MGNQSSRSSTTRPSTASSSNVIDSVPPRPTVPASSSLQSQEEVQDHSNLDAQTPCHSHSTRSHILSHSSSETSSAPPPSHSMTDDSSSSSVSNYLLNPSLSTDTQRDTLLPYGEGGTDASLWPSSSSMDWHPTLTDSINEHESVRIGQTRSFSQRMSFDDSSASTCKRHQGDESAPLRRSARLRERQSSTPSDPSLVDSTLGNTRATHRLTSSILLIGVRAPSSVEPTSTTTRTNDSMRDASSNTFQSHQEAGVEALVHNDWNIYVFPGDLPSILHPQPMDPSSTRMNQEVSTDGLSSLDSSPAQDEWQSMLSGMLPNLSSTESRSSRISASNQRQEHRRMPSLLSSLFGSRRSHHQRDTPYTPTTTSNNFWDNLFSPLDTPESPSNDAHSFSPEMLTSVITSLVTRMLGNRLGNGQIHVHFVPVAPLNTRTTQGGEGADYELLLRLAEIIGPAQPRHAQKKDVDEQLPIVIYNSEEIAEELKRKGKQKPIMDEGIVMEEGQVELKQMRVTDLMASTGDKCFICLEPYVEGDQVRVMPCKHGYHKECLDTWLLKYVNSCPLCRHAAVESTTEPSENSSETLNSRTGLPSAFPSETLNSRTELPSAFPSETPHSRSGLADMLSRLRPRPPRPRIQTPSIPSHQSSPALGFMILLRPG